MTERRGAIIFCRILAPLNAPPPQTPQYLTILLTERGALFSFVGFWRTPPPPLQTPQYLLMILMAERGGGATISYKKLNI